MGNEAITTDLLVPADPTEPLVLVIGTITSDGVMSVLKTSGREYRLKRLESSVRNWVTICELFEQYKVRAVLLKLTGEVYENLADADYATARDTLLRHVATVPHAIFAYEDLLSDIEVPPAEREPEAEMSGNADEHRWHYVRFHEPSVEVRKTVNAILRDRGLNVIGYRTNAELTVLASTFISDAEEGLLFRLYVPSGRIYASEIDKLLQLFRDYLSRIGHESVRLHQQRTSNGIVYEYFGGNEDLAPGQPLAQTSLTTAFEDFARILDLASSNPQQAEELLRNKNIEPAEITQILTKYSKEARRIYVDMKHQREQKMLGVRQRCESELVEVFPREISTEVIDQLVDSAVPRVFPTSSVLGGVQSVPALLGHASGASLTVNIRPQIVEAVNAIVAQEITGDVKLGIQDRELLQLIQQYASHRQVELASDVREIADDTAPRAGRLLARQRLKAFLYGIAAKAPDVGVGLLTAYLEKRIGV